MESLKKKLCEYLEHINNKELVRNLFIVFVIGIILIITANIFIEEKKKANPNMESKEQINRDMTMEAGYEDVLEKRLEQILSKLRGVGSVSVMITLEDTIEKIPAFNTTESNEKTNELDSQGGTREIAREDKTIQVVMGNEGAVIVLKEVRPTVKGVIVIAEGAGNLEVKERLYEAVKTVLGISGNKVEIYASK